MRYRRSFEIAARHKKLRTLIRKGHFSCAVLAKMLDVSEQTIYRDVNFLKDSGFPIRAEKHADGWAYHVLSEFEATTSEKAAVK